MTEAWKRCYRPFWIGVLASGCLVPLLSCTRERATRQPREQIKAMYLALKQKAFPNTPDLSVSEVLDFQKTRPVALVDVRGPEEQRVSIIPNAVSRDVFESNFEQYKGHTIITYCTIGLRSGLYARDLRSRHMDAYNLKGGILSWAHAGQLFVNRDGDTRRVHVYESKWDLLPSDYEGVWE